MEPKFIDLPEMNVVGIGTQFIGGTSPEKNAMSVISQLWQQFIPQTSKVNNRIGDICYGVIENPAKGADAHERMYTACVPVTSFDEVPKGMIRRQIPAGRYACFTHRGSTADFEQTLSYIYGVWLPNSKATLRDAPTLELYDRRFDHDSDISEFDVLLPVR